ncbi:MAG TPA: signal peptidase I [Gemmatimonadaceae bacterium]|jgi:signal peptidase I|nr:signal peptidase I [Gemmatimonadaceae bacterium]
MTPDADSPDAMPGGADASAPVPSEPPEPSLGVRIGVRVARGLFEWAKSVSLALLLFLFLRAFLVEAFKIPSGSMEGTLLVGDFLLVNKLVYGAEVPFTGKRLPAIRAPKNGDILVFQWPEDPTKNFVKRLVGSPGDTVSMDRGVLIRNGVRQVEAYTRHIEPNYDPVGDDFYWQRSFLVPTAKAAASYHPSRNNWGPIVVPPHHYFVLGDNRDNSLDSRYWGFVPDTLVRGSPLIVYYSYMPDSSTSFAWLTHVRWKRLFSPVR